MILVDTSAWVEFLRATGSPLDEHLTRLLDAEADLAVTDPVVMEVLAGARSEPEAMELRGEMLSFRFLRVTFDDFDAAAAIYRSCSRSGETVRSHLDCLIAAVAIRNGADLLHGDADFDLIARHSILRISRSS